MKKLKDKKKKSKQYITLCLLSHGF